MLLSKKAVETLLDLVEIKLSCLEVYDREDARELKNLEQCRSELRAIMGDKGAAMGATAVVAFQKSPPRRRRAAV